MSQRVPFHRTNTDVPEKVQEVEVNESGSDIQKTSSTEKDLYNEKNDHHVHVKEGHLTEGGVPLYEGEDTDAGSLVVADAEDIVTHVLHVDDDPTLNPWTFRALFLGIGLSTFASVLQEIFYFKPQTIYVSVVFLTVIAYVLGEFMAFAIPRKLTWLNPGPFNSKEHAFIIVCASASATSALATEILAVQKLVYGEDFNQGAGIFLVLSSQLIAYGIAGLMREILVRPTKMLWPINLPVNNLLEGLHHPDGAMRKRMKVFYIVFVCIFIWELFPEWIAPIFVGVSIPCLARQDSLVFTNLFGGSQGNEGLGFLSISLDWNYIAGLGSPLWFPLQSLINAGTGICVCIIAFMAVYYRNTWNAQDFPFLSQLLYDSSSNFTNYVPYNESLILNPDNTINPDLLAQTGLPNITATYLVYLITSNMGFTATFMHMLLWNRNDLKEGWAFMAPSNLKKLLRAETWMFWRSRDEAAEKQRILDDPNYDPHYKLMVNYKEVPNWWYGIILLLSFVVGAIVIYALDSTFPFWGYLVATILTSIFMLFFAAQYGMTGFQFNIQPICQMLGGYLHPYKPVANMYFTTFTFNSLQQGELLARDLKLAQNAHLAPRAAFTAQVLGTVIGGIFNYIMMTTIVANQAAILESIEGSNIWSGQNLQQYNTLAVAWSIAGDMFSIGGKYEWVTIAFLVGFLAPIPFWIAYKIWPKRAFSYVNTAIILWYAGNLCVGVNSSIMMYYALGFFGQFYLRKYKPHLFVKYNYLLSAALDGGTQVMVFILSFAVAGASGTAHAFPTWALNNGGFGNNLNVDYCMFNPANG